jgi:two-component system chemotaxis sensor kinase CheA
MAELRETFFLECDELLEKLETDLLSLEQGATDDELVNSAFRAVHSIKGGAGAFGMSAITDSAHVFETALDHVRSGELKLDPELCQLFLRGKDLLTVLIGAENGGPEADQAEIEAVAKAFEEVCPEEEAFDPSEFFQPVAVGGGEAVLPDLDLSDLPDLSEAADLSAFAQEEDEADPLGILAQFEAGPEAEADEAEPQLLVSFAPRTSFFERGNDAAPFIREVLELSDEPVSIEADVSRVPGFAELDPEAAYLSWSLALDVTVRPGSVEEIFEFVEEDCEIEAKVEVRTSTALDEESAAPDVQAVTEEAPEDSLSEDSLGAAGGFIDFEAEADPEEPAAPAREPEAKPVAALPLAAPAKAEPPEPAASEPAQAAPVRQTTQPKPVVRVELARVDRLINLVSELVISQSMLTSAVESHHLSTDNRDLLSGLDEFRALTRELQESVMAIRAEPVRSMFMRMGQIARSAAQVCGKKVRLVTEGEQTEVDKTVIERLAEPLTHMIRNAVDHGVEDAEKRTIAGKPPEGTIKLTAEHQSGRVVLTVKDDGGGVNREAVRKKAIEKGIIAEDAQLADAEIDQLLFAPGFSTAATISQVSGRGVGMDVVKREINALGGRISMASSPGEGTTFTISLPLTLAVLDGMLINVAGQTSVLPLSSVAESLRPAAEDIQNIGGEQVIFVRGSFVPVLDVGAALGYREPLDSFIGKVMLLVENDHGQEFAFAVDDIVDQRQVVIKGLQDNYGRIQGVAAATILGDGQIALILDVNDLTADAGMVAAPSPLAGAA